MNKILITFIMIFFGVTSVAQENQFSKVFEKQKLDVAPQYPGPGTFQEYVNGYIKNIRFKISQRVNINFVVEKDGTLSNVVFPEGTEDKMVKRILKAFKKCKKWSPGIHNSKPVRVSYTLPIRVRVT